MGGWRNRILISIGSNFEMALWLLKICSGGCICTVDIFKYGGCAFVVFVGGGQKGNLLYCLVYTQVSKRER